MEDEQIISLYFDRNEEAIRQTDIKYGALRYKIANNILNSPTDSEECVNDTYLGVGMQYRQPGRSFSETLFVELFGTYQ